MSAPRKAQTGALEAMTSASTNIMSVPSSLLEHFLPGFTTIQGFFSQWLNVDITKFVTMFFLFGAFSSTVRKVSSAFYTWLTRFLTASVSIPASDRLNKEVLLWMSTNIVTQTGTRVLAAQSGNMLASGILPPGASPGQARTMARRAAREKAKTWMPIDYYPSFGSTWFWHKGRLFLFRRCGKKYDGASPDDYWSAPDGSEPIVLICIGRSPEPLKEFLRTCREQANRNTETYSTIHLCQDGFRASWDTCLLRPVRPLETVDLDEKLKKDIVDDIEMYLAPSTRRFYARRGIPYRRGYLFHGEPGTGKTSFCLALAGRFNLELYVLNLTNLADASGLLRLFAALPPECIVVLEDVDSAGIQRELDDDLMRKKKREKTARPVPESVTLSGLLNALDGLASQEGRVLIMTSNTPDALDKALIRPGRVDKQVRFGPINAQSAESIFLRMFTLDDAEPDDGAVPSDDADTESDKQVVSSPPTSTTAPNNNKTDVPPAATASSESLTSADPATSSTDLRRHARAFAAKLMSPSGSATLTPAEVQGYLLRHRTSPAAAVAGVEAWIAELLEQRARREKARRAARGEGKAKSNSEGNGENANSEEVSTAGDEADARGVGEANANGDAHVNGDANGAGAVNGTVDEEVEEEEQETMTSLPRLPRNQPPPPPPQPPMMAPPPPMPMPMPMPYSRLGPKVLTNGIH